MMVCEAPGRRRDGMEGIKKEVTRSENQSQRTLEANQPVPLYTSDGYAGKNRRAEKNNGARCSQAMTL